MAAADEGIIPPAEPLRLEGGRRVRVLILRDLYSRHGYAVPADSVATSIIRTVLTSPQPSELRR